MANKVGAKQLEEFRQSATDPRLVNVTPRDDLALVRNRVRPRFDEEPAPNVPYPTERVKRVGVPPL